MNFTYQTYQAERPLSYREQREADVTMGELALALTELGRSVKAVLTRNGGRSQRTAANLAMIPGDNLIPVRGDELISAE
jgi:hypothetical protein